VSEPTNHPYLIRSADPNQCVICGKGIEVHTIPVQKTSKAVHDTQDRLGFFVKKNQEARSVLAQLLIALDSGDEGEIKRWRAIAAKELGL
jgi:hypothetical protein